MESRTMTVEQVIEAINEQVRQEVEWYTENADSSFAECAATLAYGELDKDDTWREYRRNSTLDEDTLDALERRFDADERFGLLKKHAYAVPGDMYVRDNQAFSVCCGEIEVEIQEDLSGFTEEELAEIRRDADACIPEDGSDLMYLNLSGDFWLAIISEDIADELDD